MSQLHKYVSPTWLLSRRPSLHTPRLARLCTPVSHLRGLCKYMWTASQLIKLAQRDRRMLHNTVSRKRAVDVPNGIDSSTRITLSPSIDRNKLPPLPEIRNPDIKTKVFTHRSFFARPNHIFEDSPNDPSPDNESYEHVGDSVLSLVITDLIRKTYPNLRPGAATKIRAAVVGNSNLAAISDMYDLTSRLLTHPAQVKALQKTTSIQANLLEAYIGGLYEDTKGNLSIVKKWLNRLFEPYVKDAYKYMRAEHKLPPEHDPSEAQGDASRHLIQFNEYLQREKLAVEWDYGGSAGQTSQTTPTWIASATFAGFHVRGIGNSKKAARNNAAKEAMKHINVGNVI